MRIPRVERFGSAIEAIATARSSQTPLRARRSGQYTPWGRYGLKSCLRVSSQRE